MAYAFSPFLPVKMTARAMTISNAMKKAVIPQKVPAADIFARAEFAVPSNGSPFHQESVCRGNLSDARYDILDIDVVVNCCCSIFIFCWRKPGCS